MVLHATTDYSKRRYHTAKNLTSLRTPDRERPWVRLGKICGDGPAPNNIVFDGRARTRISMVMAESFWWAKVTWSTPLSHGDHLRALGSCSSPPLLTFLLLSHITGYVLRLGVDPALLRL
ncbi:hypothetical protein DL546_002992 [Coniochaeta pulveracea]|uniref:Uncharacterized protein n=1 Tax=Coniochaeta pulveracea TaxID=177199 RepID=A0A420Y794_9PEZI|nr:hypothetical protein DL546_002992 [Coniochaeta pulveracea]